MAKPQVRRAQEGIPGEPFNSVVEAARAGAEWAWVKLIGDIQPVVTAYVSRLGARDPDDIIGETWLHVARGIHRFEGDASDFRSWVFMIAHHRVIDDRRKWRRKPTDFTDHERLDALAPTESSAEEIAMERLEIDGIAETLQGLTSDQREVILLRVVAGFGISEIAEIVGKKPGAVQALQHRGFKRLEKILSAPVRDEEPSSVTRLT